MRGVMPNRSAMSAWGRSWSRAAISISRVRSGKASIAVMKGFQLQPCFSFTRWTGRRIRNFKRGPGFRSARPTAFRTTVVGRDVDGHLQDITSGAVHNPSIVVAMEAQPGLIQAFAGKLFGTETAR